MKKGNNIVDVINNNNLDWNSVFIFFVFIFDVKQLWDIINVGSNMEYMIQKKLCFFKLQFKINKKE